jgi:hypothetical protein
MTRAVLFFVALTACAQTYEVRGTVTEVGAGGIPDVEVTITRFEDGAAKKTRTDGQGTYRITLDAPGIYYAGPSKNGYSGAGQAIQPLTIDAAHPQIVVNMLLLRVGEVSGRLLDEATREPVAGIEITLFTKQWRYGQLALNEAGRPPVRTDEDGRFRVTGLRPADYVASARPRPLWVEQVKDFSKADAEKIDEDFPATYWPGGGDAASAFAATLTSGGYADIGTIFVNKSPQYRVHVTIQGGCGDDEGVNLSVGLRNRRESVPLGQFPCSGELLLRGFDPGSYVLSASLTRRTGDLATTVSGVASMEIVDKNLNVTIPLQRNVVIEGQLTIVNGSTAPRLLPNIAARPLDFGGGSAILWAPDQRHFQLAVSPRTQTLQVSENGGAYVKEIRYNGTPLRGSTLPINSGSPAHKLEILVDDKWGSLAAAVTDGSRGLPATVLIVKDGIRSEDLAFLQVFNRNTAPDGTIPAAQFAPGDYRVVAVAAAQSQRMHEGGVFERLISAAQRITVSPGGAQTIAIRVSEPR